MLLHARFHQLVDYNLLSQQADWISHLPHFGTYLNEFFFMDKLWRKLLSQFDRRDMPV